MYSIVVVGFLCIPIFIYFIFKQDEKNIEHIIRQQIKDNNVERFRMKTKGK